MEFDDRLVTVLRMRAGSEAGLRTQFRQLLDLLGSAGENGNVTLRGEAYTRLQELIERLPQEEQAQILREPGLRLRNLGLVSFLASGEAKTAASAMATARLADGEWLDLIPRLPVAARGFLRHRRDLSPPVKDLLQRLGVRDLVLTGSVANDDADALLLVDEAPAETPATARNDGIGALLRRIEAFREERRTQVASPRLPLEDGHAEDPLPGFEFASDARGSVSWASGPIAPLVVGLRLTSQNPGPLVALDARARQLLTARQPLHAQLVRIVAAPEVSGDWWLDAMPIFDPLTGAFTGYRGCLRRPILVANDEGEDSAGERMREVLHELRTPVNAIQGFAEIIQQQLFGPAPHEYRAHAASIAVDSAKLLAGFDEVDRLVKLETGALALEAGETDMREILAQTVERLTAVLQPRNAGMVLKVRGSPFTVALDRAEALALSWRILATAAAALGPGETLKLRLAGNGERIRLRMKVPAALLAKEAAQPADKARRRAVSAGMFGPAFSFRLAQAEAEKAGGSLKCKKQRVTLVIPVLTGDDAAHSAETGQAGG